VQQVDKTGIICGMAQAQQKRVGASAEVVMPGWFSAPTAPETAAEVPATVAVASPGMPPLESPTSPDTPASPPASPQAAVPTACIRALELWRRSTDWVEHSSSDGAVLKMKPSPFCAKKAVWTSVFIPGKTAAQFRDFLLDDPSGDNLKSNAYKYDNLLTQRIMAKRYGASEALWHTKYKSPSAFVAARDLVTHIYEEVWLPPLVLEQFGFSNDECPTGHVYCQCGFDAGKELPDTPKLVRGAVHAFGIFAVEKHDGIHMHQVMSVDPCGYLPANLVDLANVEQLNKAKAMRKLLLAS